MQQVEDKIETLHLYVVREEEKQPYTFLPLFFALLCLTGLAAFTLYSGEHPSYEHETLHVPAILLPVQTFKTQVQIIPTGTKTILARTAHGILTITNGSVIGQSLPAGLIFVGNDDISVVTDESVFVPAGSADGYGVATVSAHAMMSGKNGNIPTYAINQVEGSSIYIRNLTAFTGGQDAYSVTIVTPQDCLKALEKARQALIPSSRSGMLLHPCTETVAVATLTWQCQFVTYHVPSYMTVTGVRIQGKNLFVNVWFVARPKPMVVK